MIFAAVYKTYVGFSARRFTTGLRAAYADGLIDAKPHFISVNRYMASRQLTATGCWRSGRWIRRTGRRR